MVIYEHKQIGTLMIASLGSAIVLIAVLLAFTPAQPLVLGFVLVVLVLTIWLFASLTVRVTMDDLQVSFGPGLIRKSFRIADIKDARAVRNPWYYGWGIRLTPRGWLFNVSGLDAVELQLGNNQKFRIGTDDPQQLAGMIRQVAQLRRK